MGTRLFVLAALPALAATIQPRSGDLRNFIASLTIPGPGTQAFVVPSAADIASWRKTVNALYTGQFQAAADLAAPLNYDLIQFSDTVRSRTFYILLERTDARGTPLRGLGTYVFNPTACRRLSIHAPHPGSDANTRPQSVALFAGLNAMALLLAGTERCANSTASTCDGSTTACGDGKFHNSDVAHNTANFFEPAHEEILAAIPEIFTIAMHGEGNDDPAVIISNGTCTAYPNQSVATQLAAQYNRTFQQLGTTLRAGTCASPGGSTTLCAEVDVQGRFANGSASLCNCQNPFPSACSTTIGCARNLTFPERFIHVEQSCSVRNVSSCSPPTGVDYDMTVAVFAAVFPCAPTIGAVVHGASFRTEPLAPGSFFTLYGEGLGTSEAAGANAAFSLGGMQAQICGMPARLVFNSGTGQINGIVPGGVSGNTSCAFSVAPTTPYNIPTPAATTRVPITPQNIGIFTYAYSASLTVPIITNAGYQLIGPIAPTFVRAKKGEVLVLWTTGGGLTTTAVADAQVAPATGAVMRTQPVIQIGGINAQILYAGLAPGFQGLYQINVTVPPSTPSGKVTLTIGSGPAYDLYVE